MGDRRLSDKPSGQTCTSSSRRGVLKHTLAFGAAAAGAMVIRHQDAGAARRGYSRSSAGGYYIVVLDGSRPGTIQTEIFPDGSLVLGRALIVSNLSGREVEVEVVPPESTAISQPLTPARSTRFPIDHAGTVLWRVWLSGDEPGDYQALDFPE